jgi:hypothetical protein
MKCLLSATGRGALLLAALSLMASPALAQTAARPAPAAAKPAPAPPPLPSVATLSRLIVEAPVIAVVRVRSATRPPRTDPAPPAGRARVILTADVQKVIAATDPVPARIRYTWEGPADAKGRAPSFNRQVMMVFARPEAAFDGPYALVGATPQLPWSEALEARVRELVGQAQRPQVRTLRLRTIRAAVDAEPDAGFARATGFVIDQAGASPVTLLVRDQSATVGDVAISWSDATQSVEPVTPNTLLWAQIACALPPRLPPDVVADYVGAQDSDAMTEEPVPIDPEAAAAVAAARAAAEAAAKARGAARAIEVERAYGRMLARLGPCQ